MAMLPLERSCPWLLILHIAAVARCVPSSCDGQGKLPQIQQYDKRTALKTLLLLYRPVSALVRGTRDPLPRRGLAKMSTSSHVLENMIVNAPTTLTDEAWRQAFGGLVSHQDFVDLAWYRRPAKLVGRWDFAIGAYTMDQVQKDVSLLPPQFIAHGVQWNNGMYTKPMESGFTYTDVQDKMQSATVVMLNAGFVVPTLAKISLAMLKSISLPIWLNVYLTRPGLSLSTPLHTDKQDVLLVQTSGLKRWRVYSPPAPVESPQWDPFSRGKGTDIMGRRPEDLLIDTVMEPGQVMYIPAAFPHETDTLDDNAEGGFSQLMQDAHISDVREDGTEASVHLTVGVDTHLWGLTWAKMRELALRRANLPVLLASGDPVNTLPFEKWSLLHSPLAVGFDGSATEDMLMNELVSRLVQCEPSRWADEEAVRSELPLREAAAVMLLHYRRVLQIQREMYERTASKQLQQDRLFADMDALDSAMQSLEDWANAKDILESPSRGFSSAGSKSKTKTKKKTKTKRR